ncbi:MAG TPA: MarR family winged helix-turn-helix transcriptional regulator [Hyphomicrobium sp.]|nr:MarR family winged helix-turn-helix transcriptional regulator [Hyphomicrobium sp.]
MSTALANKAAPRGKRRSEGGAVMAAHFRRLSERLDRDATQVYSQLGVPFEQRWMSVLDLLVRCGPRSVSEIARDLNISHPSVSQTRSSLIAAKLLAERADPNDGRRRVLYLTAKGERLVERLQPVWAALEQAGQELNEEAGNVVALLKQLEAALDRQSILDRVNKIQNARSILESE